MNITKRVKVAAGAVALAGAVSLTGGAFTATGVQNEAGASQFVGGTVSQTVTGATLSKVEYSFKDASNTGVTSVALSFGTADSDGKAATVKLTHGETVTEIACVDVASQAATCTVDAVAFPDGITGVSNIDVTVASENVA